MKTQVKPSARLRLTAIAAALIASTALVACGGGSGNTVLDQPGMALFTSAASAITLAPGQTSTFTVGGGGSGSQFVSYKASSSNESIVTASINGTKLTLAGLAGGTAIVNVTDSAGANVVINVTVPAATGQALALAAPSAVTLAPGNTTQYKISGGTGPYTAVSSNPNIAAVATGPDSLSVTAANSGSATIVVFDSKGASTQLSLNVSGADTTIALYTTAPQSVNLGANATAAYQIAGGVGPYTATSSYTDVVTAAANGSTLTLQASSLAGQATINITDAVGTKVSFIANVNSSAPVLLHTTAPSSLSIGVGPAPTYQVQGGIGPYAVSSSNPGVATASISGSALNISGLASGTAQIVVFDSTGASSAVAVTVAGGSGVVPLYTTAPDSITVKAGAAPTYTIAGGAAPYVVTSSDVTIATVSQTDNTFTVTGVSTGLAQVSVHDANGSSKVIVVNVK